MCITRSQARWLVGIERVRCSLCVIGFCVLRLHSQPVYAADSYAFGLLFHTVFNSAESSLGVVQVPLPPKTLPRGEIPQSVFPSVKKLLDPNTKTRMSPKTLLSIGMAEQPGESSTFFSNNQLIKICSGLDNFSLGSDAAKAAFLR